MTDSMTPVAFGRSHGCPGRSPLIRSADELFGHNHIISYFDNANLYYAVKICRQTRGFSIKNTIIFINLSYIISAIILFHRDPPLDCFFLHKICAQLQDFFYNSTPNILRRPGADNVLHQNTSHDHCSSQTALSRRPPGTVHKPPSPLIQSASETPLRP